MRTKFFCLAIALCTHLSIACSAQSASPGGAVEVTTQSTDGDTDTGRGETIKFRPILSSQYANFPVNWSEKHVYRLGLLRSASEYEQVFNSAAVAGNRLPYAPDPKLYESEMILVVSRVTATRVNLDRALQIDSIIANGKTLEVTFTFREGTKNESYSVKVTGAARIPKREVERVVFFEGKKQIGTLQVSQGQWLAPEPEVAESSVP